MVICNNICNKPRNTLISNTVDNAEHVPGFSNQENEICAHKNMNNYFMSQILFHDKELGLIN